MTKAKEIVGEIIFLLGVGILTYCGFQVNLVVGFATLSLACMLLGAGLVVSAGRNNE